MIHNLSQQKKLMRDAMFTPPHSGYDPSLRRSLLTLHLKKPGPSFPPPSHHKHYQSFQDSTPQRSNLLEMTQPSLSRTCTEHLDIPSYVGLLRCAQDCGKTHLASSRIRVNVDPRKYLTPRHLSFNMCLVAACSLYFASHFYYPKVCRLSTIYDRISTMPTSSIYRISLPNPSN